MIKVRLDRVGFRLSTMLSTVLQYVFLLFSLAAFGISLLAMQFALTNKRDERNYRQLLMHLAELEDLFEALNASHKRLRSRVGMRELREKRKVADNVPDALGVDGKAANDDTPEEWKRRMRLKLHKGEIKP